MDAEVEANLSVPMPLGCKSRHVLLCNWFWRGRDLQCRRFLTPRRCSDENAISCTSIILALVEIILHHKRQVESGRLFELIRRD
jgi:hypothetical protein